MPRCHALTLFALVICSISYTGSAKGQAPHIWIDAEIPTSIDYQVVQRPNGWYHFLRDIAVGQDRDIPVDGQGYLWISGTSSFTGTRSIGTRAYPSTSPGHDRVEVRVVHGANDGSFSLKNATTKYFGYAFMVHPQMQAPTDWLHVMQVWQRPLGNVPAEGKVPFTVSLTDDFRLIARTRTHLVTTPIWTSDTLEKGRWYSLVYELRPSYNGDGHGGYVAIWLDGVEVVRQDGDWGNPPSLGYTEYFDVRAGIYRAAQNTHTIIMYDDLLFADTLQGATP